MPTGTAWDAVPVQGESQVVAIGAMLALFFGLVTFLKEISIATRSLRIGPH